MKVGLSAASRYRVLAAILALLVATVWVISVKPATVATAAVPTVGDYLKRVVRAMGLEGRVGSRAPAGEYLSLLVQQRVFTADAARGLRIDQPLTRDVALEVSSRLTDPPAPPFLSKTYVVTAWLADEGIGLGLVRDDDQGDQELFEAEGHEHQHHCPTPRHRHGHHHDDDDEQGQHADDEDQCPEEP